MNQKTIPTRDGISNMATAKFKYYTLTEFKLINTSKGFNWFAKPAMDRYNSKVEVWQRDGYFITSETVDENRVYCLRRANFITGGVENLDYFRFESFENAKERLRVHKEGMKK